MESSDEETLSERSYVSERSERSLRSERSGGSLSPCPSGLQGPSGDTLPWNRPSRHERGERRKRKTHNSVLDPAERAVVRVADERDRVQKKTFMKWVNKHLIKVRKHITDLYEDLRDGHNLISLLEVLSGVTLPREKGRMRFHRLQNVQIALDFLKQRQVKLVNIRNDDITDGNPKLTLGLIWTIILHFQISEIYVSGESGDLTAKEKLLLWSQKASEGWPGLRCTNFSSSWSDGRMFNALLHRFRPDLIDMEVVAQQSNLDNLEQAFEIAESLGVTRLLDAEDVDVPSPDEKSVITYVSSIYDAFPKIPEGGEGIAAHEVDHRWAEYRSRFSMLLQWSRQHKALMANKNFPLDPVELKALYNEYVHFKETEIPAKELEKGRVEHLYKLLEVWMEFGRIKLPLGLHPNDLEEEWGKLILEMLEREKALRPAVERLELLLQMANKIQNMALDCEEKLTLAKNTLQADMSLVESGEAVRCERELGLYLQDCEVLIRQLNLDLNILRDEKYYQVEQLAFRSVAGEGELVSLRLQCSSVYRKGHFSPVTGGDRTAPRGSDSGLSLSTGAQTLLGAVGVVGAMGAALLRRPMSRSQLVAMSSSEDEGSLRFIYELLGWVEETQDVLERAEWGADLPSVEQNLQDHQNVHTAVEELLHSLKEARNYETKVSPNFRSSYSDTLAKLEHLYCKLLELSSWRLRCLESLHAFVCRCTEELIWLNEREEEELAYDWSQNNTNVNAKRELYAEMRSELEEKQEVMHSLQETADRLCQENHPAKQTVEAYSAALQTQWQWVRQLCVCVEQHLKDNTTYFQFVSDARDCETYLRQLQDTIKRQYTCDKSSRLGKLEDLLQDSMEEKEQLIEYRSSVASLVGRAKTVVQLRPRSAESTLGSTTPIRAICDYRQIEITISRGEECVLADNSQRTKWKVISPSGNEAMVPSVCFTVPPPNQEAMDTASRMEQLYQNVMSLWHNLHVSMKSVVSWHYLQKDIRTVSSWSLDTVRHTVLTHRVKIQAHLADFLSDSKESGLFTPTERRELERDAHTAQEHCQDLLVNMETVEKDESVSRSYLSELQNIKLRLEEAEQRLMRGIQTPPPSNRSGDSIDNTVQIAEQEKLQSDLDGLRTSLGEVSRRCVSFFEEKPTSSSVPLLRSELNLAVEKIDRLHNLSSVYLHKLKTVDVLMYSLQAAESQVKRYESRLSEEDIVPADTNAIQALREQLGTWQSELEDQEGVFSSLQSEVQKAREAGTQLNRLHPDRSPELERYQEKAAQLTERWAGVKRQMDTRRGELEALGSVLQQYRDGHSALIHWIEETTERQENTQPGKTDSKVLSEQLAQQTALVADIEKNQTKLDECQTHSKQYCTSVKDYELQLMTFRAFVESTQKSTGKRRRMHSSSDAITQEFMDLRTRYTALVTLTTQHVKYISDALRRLEEEEKEVEEERQQRVGQVSELLGWVKGLQGRAGDPSAESSIKRLSSRLSPEERAQVTSQLDELTATYSQLCDSSTAQLQQLVQQQSQSAIGGVIDLGTMETVPVFQAAQRGLIDLDTCHVLLEAQLTVGGLFQPDSPGSLSLEEGLNCGLIDSHISQSLSELESALHLVDQTEQLEGQLLPVAAAMEEGLIKEEVGLRILELQINTGGLKDLGEGRLTLNSAGEMDLLTPRVYSKLCSRVNRRELIDPNTADKLNLSELQQRCVLSDDTGLYLLPVKQQPGGTVCLRSGRKVGIFRAVQEGLIDRQVAVRLLEAQLFAGGISDPRSGHLLTVNEAVRHNLMNQDLACAMLTRQLQYGGILDPVTGDRLGVEEAIQTDLLSPHLALLVLESLWAFIGMLWPESGELLPIAEALQQGVISQELAWNILRQRHAIGALYLPETPKVVSLNQAKEVLEPKVAEILKEIQIPDKMAPEEQAHHRLLFHVMTHSYVDAHSGQRLVLLEPELVELVKAAAGLISVDSIPGVVEEGLSLTTERQECMEVAPDVCLPDTPQTREVGKVQEKSAIFSLPEKYTYPRKMVEEADNQGWDGTPDTLQAHQTGIKEMGQVDLDSTMRISEEVDGGVHREVKGEKDEMVSFESAPPSAGLLETQVTDSYEDGLVAMESEGSRESGHRKAKEEDSLVEDVDSPLVEALEMYSTPVKPETLMPTQYFKEPDISPSEADEKESVPVSVEVNYAVKDTPRVTEKTLPQVMGLEAAAVKTEEDVELERLASELQQGGLLTEGGQRLLPDEAVAQGVLPGHTAVKLMAKAGLFGGFLDVGACESLSIEDVMQEGLLDEDLMWRVLKSEKTLAGVVDVEKGKICTLKDAAQAGLIDSNTAARLLEAQVVSGGVVDLRRDKKVSVTLAANLGLIEEDQREKLFALEKSCRGKGSDPDASLTKATLQLQMNGVVDPKTKSPVPLRQALERGLLGQEEVYQALSQQVAEGGIVHHNSGVRLSISDALQRGLVDCAISPKLWELERACQGEVALSSNPDAALLQASTGAILDPDLKCRLTLTEAVSDGLLNESIAKKAMVSPGVTEGILDPQSAQIVPYSDLVNQGKIDIKSGKRFLEVKPFKGIQDKQTGEILNLAKAIASQQVDPVPALRMLQSQADTGGIIDISNGARIPLPKASKKGLVGEHMARLIATNQVLKGGLLDPSTGQRVSSLRKAVKDGLISREMAAELQDNLGSMEVVRDDEDSSTPVASSSGTYSPADTLSISSPDSQTRQPNQTKPIIIKTSEDIAKTLEAATFTQSGAMQHHGSVYIEDKMEEEQASVAGKSSEIESNQSINLLAQFTNNAEKRLQQALQEMETPQDVTVGTPEKDNKNVSRSVGERSSIMLQGQSASGKEPRMDLTVAIGREGRDQEGSIDMSTLVERDEGKTHVVEDSTERVVEQGRMEVEQDTKIEARERDDQRHASANSNEAEGKSKKKRKNKKKGKGKEVDTQQRPSEKADIQKTENKDQNVHSEGKGHNCKDTGAESTGGYVTLQEKEESPVQDVQSVLKGAKVQTVERFGDPKGIGKVREGSTVPPGAIADAPEVEREGTENKVFLVQRRVEKNKTSKISKASEKVEPVTEEIPSIHDQADSEVALTKAVLESLDKKSKIPIGAEKVEPATEERSSVHKDEQKWEVEQIVEKSDPDGVETVSQQTGQQEHKDRKAVEFTLKTTPVANDKKALLLKAKESILRKVLGRGVSEKQAAEELVALRQVVGKRESLVTSEEEVKTVGSPPEVSPEEREGQEIDKKGEGEREKVAPDHSTVTVAAEEVKKALEVEKEENVRSDQSKREEEGEKVVLDQIEEVKEEDTSLTDQLKETKSGKKKKNNKKSKMVEKVEPAAEEKPSIHIRADSTPADVDSSVSGDERKTEKQQDGQSDSDVTKVASGDEMNKMAAFTKSPSGVDTNQQRSTHTTAPYQVDVHLEEKTEEDISLGRETDPHGKEIEQFRIGTPEKDAELQQLQAQQAQLMQVSQNARSLLDQPDSAVPAEEKRRLRDQLDQLQTQHQEKLRACQERLRRSEALKDELAKFLQEHGGLGTWLEQSEGELGSLGEGETDAQGLKGRLEEHRKVYLAEDVICHKADLRFVSISGQKVLDSVQGALEKLGGSDPALEETKQLVTGKLQDANHRYTALHTKVITTPTLSPLPLPLSEPDGLEKRFSSLSESMSERAEQLQTSVAQSVSVQEGLKGLLAWLDGLLLTPGPVQPTAQAVQDLLSRQGSVEATCDSVSKLLQSSDASTASGLQASLESLTQSYTAAQAKQAEREAELRGLLPKLENYERLSADLQGFTQTCLRALSPVGQPDRSVEDYRQTIEVRGRMIDISSCEQQLGQFRSLSGSLLRWLQTTQEQNYVRPLITFKHFFTKDLLSDWEAQGVRVLELNKTGSELETLIINITAPQTKTGKGNGKQLPMCVSPATCMSKFIQALFVSMFCEASLELRQKARQSTEELSRWLGDRENSLHLGQTAASPSKPEVVRAQAQENKALLSELAEHSGKVKELKSTLEKLIADNPDSPEADTWRQQMKEIDSRWAKANEAAVQRQVELETCADRLGSFATAASQLGPWLKEKELMMSVLGPLSIDPNMLNTQNQQFMLREFDTRRPQFDQLTQAAEGILSPSGGDSSPQDAKDLAEVRSELGSISQQWDDLTQRLSRRSGHIGQAQGTSERYQALLKNLSVNVGALGERLDGQASLSAQPEALKRRLQETGEIRSELEQRREELGEAEKLCGELSAIVVEPYLRDELKKRLESVSGPLRSLEERAADGLSQLQAALSSTQQFQQMFEELRSWLDNQSGQRDSTADSLPCQPEAIRTLLAQQDELHRGVASQRGPYELIQAEGASLLASLPAGGEERSALLSRLTALRQDWDELNQCITERQNRLKSALTKAESYQQHRAELTPWVVECEEREADIQLSLDPAALDEALQKARQLGLDLERRRPLLEALNIAADQLLEHCRVGEEDVRDEKAQLNRRVDGLAENLQNRVSQLEELAGRLKEFEDGRQAVERRLEAARHQIEVQEALGPQACSNKSLERLRSQQETLQSLQPQVAYLRDLAQGLVQDAPHTAPCHFQLANIINSISLPSHLSLSLPSPLKIEKCCSTLESRLQGVGEVQSSVRDLFSHLADLDDELDSLSPVGRDADSLASQADAVHAFLARLATLRSELEGHGGDCTAMLRREGSSPDLLALRRETEALSRQAGKLSERGQARVGQIEVAAEKVAEFYAKVAELQGLLGRAEEGLNAQGVVGTEVETIKQQLHEFKAVEREQVDSIQPKLQRVNAVGQGLIQSAAKHTDTQALEHDLETTNLRWNSLNKRVAERIAQLQEALLHCGKFQDALEPLLSWLSDTEDLVANQKPPSAEYRVVKAQIQEQKLLQRLLDDRRATFQMIQGEGERIAATAETQDRDKIQKQLESLGERWGELLEKARARQCQLEELQTLALQFHEAVEPLGEWLSATERRLSTAEPMGTQTSKITQQITKHKSLNEEIVSRKKQVDQAIKNGQALLKQTTGEEVLLIQEKLDGIKSRYAEMTGGSSRALRTLEQALQLSTRFASAHDDLNHWLDKVEAELNVMEPDATPAYQDRQKELKCVSAEKRLVLDTVNEVGNALLDLVPWRAREGLDRLVADANQRYRTAAETITQRVKLVQAAIQRSQQYEEAVDAELTWAGETERKLSSLGPLSLEPDVTVAQLQVQRAFNIDIIRHKDTVDQLLHTRDDILETCSDQQRDALVEKTDSLSARYEAVSQQHQERFSALEQAQVLVARFWETQEDLEPWLGETETLIAQLPPPAIDTEALRLQQEQMRLLRESIAEHKPHIDKLLKIGPQLAALSHQEGATVKQRYSDAEKRYVAIKEVVKGRATTLDEAVSQSAQFHDKMDPLLETLEGAVQRLRSPPPVAAEADKIREQLADHKATGLELDKLLPSFSALCARGEELISRAAHDDPAAQGESVRSRLLRLRSLWDEIRQRAEEREGKLTDVLDLAGKFWADMAALLSTLRDSQDIVRELEDPGVDPSLIKQQIEAAEAIKAETDGLREELEFVRTLGADLIFACGETEKPEVKKTIDEMNAAWEGLNRTWRERMERLEEAMTASVQYQDALQSMFDYLDNAVIKLCDMSTVGTDLGTVKQQIEELKHYKVEVYQQQIDMEKLCHQGELLLKKVSDQTDRDMIQEPLTELRHLWDNLGDKITHRQHKLEGALLALGQFQHALSELQSWLSHTHATLDTQRPVNSDPKAIEIELAKHHVLRNDVLSHRSTVETVNAAGAELLESSPGDEANHLRGQLDHLNRGWENLLLKTQDRQKLLEAALHQAEGFHGELEEFLQWLRRTESQLSAAKPTGGLPETAREQLQQHLELQTQLAQRAEQYNRLLDAGESMLLSRGGEERGPGAGTTQTQQNLALLQNKWASLNTKMDDRTAKLDEAVSLATGFQSSLQDTINWLTQAEQTLNMAQPPSLILDTVLFQIDEHKVFVNEVNTHREQVLALEKAGSQLRFASIKQDVVLIKNLLLSVQARWDKLVQRSLDRGRHLDEARKRAKQFHEAWRKLSDWLEEAESRLDSELEISNEPDKIRVQLTKHKEFQKALGSKQPVYDTTVRSGKAMRDKATLPEDTQKLDHLLGEVRDKWDTVCGKSVERQHKLEEALLFSGQFAEALQALVDWLYRVEPQLAEDLPVHGDLDLVSNLMDSHKAFQKELGKRTTSVHALKRSARELMETGRDDTAWVKVQLQELSNRWDTVCALSVTKQTRLQQALKQAEEFRTAVRLLLEWLSEAEQTLRFRGVLPEEAETLQALLHTHRNFMATVEEKRTDVNRAAGQGEAILTACQADCITTIKHWITIIRARFEEVLTWAKQHEQRLETALTELLNNATLLEELLSWLQWAETTLVQRDGETLPQDIPQLKTLITEHQVFMEEMTRKQPDVDKVTKTYKRKPAEPPSSLAERRGARKNQQQQPHQQAAMQVAGGNPRLTQLCSRWQQVWLLALDRQRKLNDALDRLEELKEFASFDFDVWRKKYMRWMNHKKSRVMDFFRRIDKDQDGKITRQEFIDGILASKFPTSRLEMTAVADIFDQDGDGYIDYYEFVAALHPNKDAYRPTTDADKIEDEVTRQVAQCKCAKRFQVEQIGENKYRFFLGNQFGDSQQLRLVRILRSTVMVRVGGGWMALDEFLVKNDPCRARGRTNLELREKFILPEGASQGLAAFRSRGRRSKPGSRTASPTRSSSSASHSAHSCASLPSTPATPTASSRGAVSGSKLKRPTFHSSRGSLTGENGGATPTSTKPGRTDPRRTPSGASGAASRAGSRAGSRASSRRGSDASDASELLETRSACSDTSDTPRRPGAAKPSKIPTISKKAPSPKTPASGKK
uniref:Microtubule-actin cross-linking factor 1-like n=1 Tax=Oncorhynchus mykiss TaxID=8022 RepID=A0A8C7UPH9_ONCMY